MSVYFARVGKYIKIGHSGNPVKRVQRIRSDSSGKPMDLDRSAPVELLRVIDGNRGDEWRLHEALWEFRHTCEWFLAERDLIAYVETVVPGSYPYLSRTGGKYEDPPPSPEDAARLAAALEEFSAIRRGRVMARGG